MYENMIRHFELIVKYLKGIYETFMFLNVTVKFCNSGVKSFSGGLTFQRVYDIMRAKITRTQDIYSALILNNIT
jgi:hypothetical protein